MSKILVATEKPFAPVAVEGIREIIENNGIQFELLENYTDKSEFLRSVESADALIVRSDIVDEAVICAGKNLKLIVRAGAGYDNIDLKCASAKNIVVENTPGQNSNAVAELVFGMIVMAARNMFSGTTGYELYGKRLGLQAFGQVGRNVARIAKGFGMNVEAYDPYCSEDVMSQFGVKPVASLEELYSECDVVSIHIPATPETVGSIGYSLVSKMPKNGILVNTARKEVIDYQGLEQALRERPDLKYVADVKPDNWEHFNEQFKNRVLFTPKKMGAQTFEANVNAGLAAARQCVDFIINDEIKFRVN